MGFVLLYRGSKVWEPGRERLGYRMKIVLKDDNIYIQLWTWSCRDPVGDLIDIWSGLLER